MPNIEAVDRNAASSRSVVELRVRADATQLSIIRAVAAAIAGQEDFDLDAIADVRLAIDEACSHLILRAVDGASLVCRFRPSATDLNVSISAPTSPGEAPSQRSFGWHVLNALTDSIELTRDVDPDNPSGEITVLTFTKNKQGSDA